MRNVQNRNDLHMEIGAHGLRDPGTGVGGQCGGQAEYIAAMLSDVLVIPEISGVPLPWHALQKGG